MASKNKRADAPISQAVAENRNDASPAAYARRYQFTLENGGRVVPRGTAESHTPKVLNTVRFNRNAANELEAYVPALAYGQIGMMPGVVTTEWNVDNVAEWDMSYIPNDGKQDIRAARRWWRWDPLVFKCCKVLAQLSNARLTVECDNAPFKEIIENWLKMAVCHTFRKQWFLEYYRSSMVPVLKNLIPYKPRDYKNGKIPLTENGRVQAPMERATGESEATQALVAAEEEKHAEFTKAYAEYKQAEGNFSIGLCSEERLKKLRAKAEMTQSKWLSGNVAAGYTILDPLDIWIEGPPEMAWLRQPYLMVGGAFCGAIMNPTPQQAEMISKLPMDLARQIREGAHKIWLSPNICTVTYGEKQPYERYPTPIVIHCDEALKLKMMLYQMDKAVSKSVRDKILKVTVGNDEYPAFDQGQIDQVAAIFNNPSRNLTIFWNHTLNIEWVEPNDTGLADEKKYAHVNSEIRTAFGISSMITGTGDKDAAVGDGIINLKGLVEEVGEGQETFLEWLDAEIDLFKQALGVGFEVRVFFDKLNLKDADKFMALLLQLYQGGVIDPETAISTMGFNFPTISKRMEAALKLRKKGLFMPIPSANNMGPDGALLPQKGKPGGSPKGGGIGGKGRPSKQPKKANQQKRGTSQPKKAKAKLIPAGMAAYLVVDREFTPEERTIAATKFSIPEEWVLTEAEYHAKTGKGVDWLPPLPQLESISDVVAAMECAKEGKVRAVEAAEQKFAAIKASGSGPRGKYITAEDKRAVLTESLDFVVASSKPGEVTDEEWGKRLEVATAELAPQQESLGISDEDLPLYAATFLACRFAKRKKAK